MDRLRRDRSPDSDQATLRHSRAERRNAARVTEICLPQLNQLGPKRQSGKRRMRWDTRLPRLRYPLGGRVRIADQWYRDQCDGNNEYEKHRYDQQDR